MIDDKINALRRLAGRRIGGLFAADARRFEGFSCRVDDLLLDFSKTSISRAALAKLLALAKAAGVEARRDEMFAGKKINRSEGRAVGHAALRAGENSPLFATPAARRMAALARAQRAAMLRFAEQCRAGKIAAANGKRFLDVVNIGIGGSDLGVAMATAALAPFGKTGGGGKGLRAHFVANMDGAHLRDVLANLRVEKTLVVVSSKTFTTAETLSNARLAQEWLQKALGKKAAAAHIVAATAAPKLAAAFGVSRVFCYGNWVGGRFSLWGAAGLPLALSVGAAHFNELLRGAESMDLHFCQASAAGNMPLLLGLVGVWHRNVCGYPTRAILPYDERLRLLPAHLQQLDMESNGKSAGMDGKAARLQTAPVVWGSAGTNAQHAYFQMLHQGADIVPAEFVVSAKPVAAPAKQHRLLLANCLAQSAALMQGDKTAADAQKRFAGNRPSITLMQKQLTPFALGRLLALYEHRAFVEGVIWEVNSFDQWGVQLGKSMAKKLAPLFDSAAASKTQDASTRGLLAHCRANANK